jgi:uncharacterized protein
LGPVHQAQSRDLETEPECGINAGMRPLTIAGVSLVGDHEGALFWPEEGLLAVADLHLEKGSSFAARGVLLPPYDTAATLARLARIIARYAPRTVVALGDSFHDDEGPGRIAEQDRATLSLLQRRRDWVWIAGNHDSKPISDLGGTSAASLAVGALLFRHEPDRTAPDGEIAGHLHPVARVRGRGRLVSRRCFATDGRRAVMPAFGSFAGGLNVRDRAFAGLFRGLSYTAHMLGSVRLYAVSAKRCVAD